MQINERRYVRFLSWDDAMDVWIRRNGPVVVDFAVNQRTRWQEQWRTVLRYDTSHGQRLHVHRAWRPEPGDVEWLEPSRSTDYRAAVTHAILDVSENWRRHRELAMGAWRDR